MNEVEIISTLLLDDRPSPRVMIDVGAHHGGACRAFVEREWTVYAFEPDPENRGQLVEYFETNSNVFIDHRAVTNSASGEQPWFKSDESTGISGLSAFRDSHTQSTTVDTVDLASFCLQREISDIDFLKIDTEGHDLMVLRGFDWSDESQRPRVILCEFEDGKSLSLGYRWGEMAEFLAAKGYRVIVSEWKPIVRYGIEHQWRCFHRYPCSLVDEGGWGNLIAIRDEEDLPFLVRACERAESLYHARGGDREPAIYRKGLQWLRCVARKFRRPH